MPAHLKADGKTTDWASYLFDDTEAALVTNNQHVLNEVDKRIAAKEVEINQREFWRQFYEPNPDLRIDDATVRKTLHKHFDELACPSQRVR